MVDINPVISIITLNVIDLNIPATRQIFRVDPKQDPTICFYKKPTLNLKTCIVKENGRENVYTMLTLIKRKQD